MHKKCRGLITTVFIFAIKTAVGCGENQLIIEKSMNTSMYGFYLSLYNYQCRFHPLF